MIAITAPALVHPKAPVALERAIVPVGLSAAVACVAVVAVAVAAVAGSQAAVVVAIVALVPAAVAATVDVRSRIVPDRLVLLTALPPLLVAATAAASATAVVAGSLVLAAPLFVAHVVSPGSMGFGDVKLGAALGAVIGLAEPRLALVALCIATAGAACAAVIRRRPDVPFAPALVIGAVATLLVAHPLTPLLTGGATPWR